MAKDDRLPQSKDEKSKNSEGREGRRLGCESGDANLTSHLDLTNARELTVMGYAARQADGV